MLCKSYMFGVQLMKTWIASCPDICQVFDNILDVTRAFNNLPPFPNNHYFYCYGRKILQRPSHLLRFHSPIPQSNVSPVHLAVPKSLRSSLVNASLFGFLTGRLPYTFPTTFSWIALTLSTHIYVQLIKSFQAKSALPHPFTPYCLTVMSIASSTVSSTHITI